MRKILFIMFFATKVFSSPFPQAGLDPEILARFSPYILEELGKEFAHQNNHRAYRDTREYGYSFFKLINGDFSYESPPAFLQELGSCICLSLGHEPQEFTNIILSLYEEGYHLQPHIDRNSIDYSKDPFFFDEKVYGIIIEPDITGHLYFVNPDPVYSLEEKAGSIFCLQGSYRKAPYRHGVSRVSNRRISITFRTVIFADQKSC